MKTAVLWIGIQTAVCALSVSISHAGDRVRYNRDVLPILSSSCFACHGPDAAQRQAELRLDVPDKAVSAKAIVPGKTQDSGL